ncbi:MAG TPA: DUF11 domain-containing protein, partial [Pyrinomonadaceae bacterium]|nr:DUF11 domain-containing protein [Pyrinomonadaceae bacterium]
MKQRSTEKTQPPGRTKRARTRSHFARALFCLAAALVLSLAAAASVRAQEDQLTADMSVEKTGAFEAVAGQSVFYTITLTNIGTTDATNVVLTDNVPANTTPFSFTQES